MLKRQRGFFDESARQARLEELDDPLSKLNAVVDWEAFRSTLESALSRSCREKGGRPSFDVVFMFKVLILQRLNNLSDERTEFLITDRLSFMRFLGLQINDKVPDAKTIRKLRIDLVQKGTARKLFDVFDGVLRKEGLISRHGSIIDATIIEAPRQDNTREENAQIKKGEVPSS